MDILLLKNPFVGEDEQLAVYCMSNKNVDQDTEKEVLKCCSAQEEEDGGGRERMQMLVLSFNCSPMEKIDAGSRGPASGDG